MEVRHKYPLTMPCRKRWPSKPLAEPCPGKATMIGIPQVIKDNDRGPWYGCDRCGCMAQYQDFKEHPQ